MAKRKGKSSKGGKTPKPSKRQPVSPDSEEKSKRDAGQEPEAEEGAAAEEATSLVTVVHARNTKEAKTMKSILESAEIPAFIGQEEADPGEAGRENEAVAGIPILVPEEMAGEAAEILAEAAMHEEEEDEEDKDLDEDWEEEEEDEELLGEELLEDVDEEDEEYDEDLDDEDAEDEF